VDRGSSGRHRDRGRGGTLLAFGDDPLEAARRRVPLGADEDAVAEAMGRPADGLNHKAGRGGPMAHRVLFWRHGNDTVLVEFDTNGRAVKAWAHY